MKKTILLFSLFVFVLSVKSQISLEHTFTTDYSGVAWFSTSAGGIKYYIINDTISNQVTFYNEDYSIYKTVQVNRPSGYSINVLNPSDQLFNTDNSLEFICYFVKSNYPNYIVKISIYNENGQILKDFNYNYIASPVIISNGNNTKLCIRANSKNSNSNYVDEIYSLPGHLASSLKSFITNEREQPYPNPTNTIINLPYNIKTGTTSILRIYNINGQLIQEKQIDSIFDNLLLDVSAFHSGIYLYEYNGISNSFIVN